MSIREHIKLFMEPRSIAVVGASRATGPGALNMVENLLTFGYVEKIFPVNPKAEDILGIRTYPAVTKIPETADLAVIITPRQQTVKAVRESAERGIKAIIVIGQGFGDGDNDGKRMQEEMVEIARRHGSRLMGPNTLGILNYYNRMNASLVPFLPENPSPIAIISQTGVFCLRYPGFMPLGKVFDIGNASDLSFSDVLEYLEDDPDTKVIFLYLEGVKEGRRFLEVAGRVARKKPILVLKAGSTEAGRKAVVSHTGTLTSEDAVYEAAFRHAGLIRIVNLEELHDSTKALLHLPLMKGKRLAVVTSTGAGGIMATDAAEAAGLQIARVSEPTRKTLERFYPEWMEVGNPFDIWPGASIGRHGLDNVFRLTLETLIKDDEVDGILAICIAASPGWGHFAIPRIVREAAEKSDKPIVSWFFGPDMETDAAEVEKTNVSVAYPTVERAVKALWILQRYANAASEEPSPEESPPIDRDVIREIFLQAMLEKRNVLAGKEALEILKACGISIPFFEIVHSKDDALIGAEKLGYPVVMKLLSARIIHKTEMGGVIANIKNGEEAKTAFDKLERIAGKYCAPRDSWALLIQEMVLGGKEVILGMKRDAQFGPILMFGLGGIYTELLKDVVFRIAPITRQEARRMISEVKFFPLLKGFRGEKAADLSALEDVLVRVSQLVVDFPEIQEMDINPFLALEKGKGGKGIDARFVFANHKEDCVQAYDKAFS